MKLRHETAAATLTQFIVMLVLNFVNALQSIISGCMHHDGCVSGVVINLLFIVVLSVWLLFLAAVGYAAEHRRSRGFATLLIVAEALVVVATISNIRHYPNLLGLLTSLVDFALAAWVILLAYRLRKLTQSVATDAPTKAPKGQRPRKRLSSTTTPKNPK